MIEPMQSDPREPNRPLTSLSSPAAEDSVMPEPPAHDPEETVFAAERTTPAKRLRIRHAVVYSSVAVLLLIVTALVAVDAISSTLGISRIFNPNAGVGTGEAEPPAELIARNAPFTFNELDIHPANRYAPRIPGGNRSAVLASQSPTHQQFLSLLDLFEKRQGVDDNFTIRMVNSKTGQLLELFTLDEDRARYQRTGRANWGEIDEKRRAATRQLVRKYTNRGIAAENVSAKWGRANQVLEARERDRPFIEYEIKLARQLGLTLLTTEIGTVETFNQDHLVSSVGARSRYQLMPDNLRRLGLHQYTLTTANGRTLNVRDEQNSLLAVEPSFYLVKGYTNAVGHEIPGVSSYHTGPGNMFSIYRLYLNAQAGRNREPGDVLDAFIWGVTDGYPVVSKQTTFRDFSRGYVPSAYGALRAVEALPIDPNDTYRMERVQLKPGRVLLLSNLLEAIERSGAELTWGNRSNEGSLYARFRRLNPHFGLPESEDGQVPANGNVRLQRAVGQAQVRFFLPLGASEALKAAGVEVIDESSVFRYDENTFADPADTGEQTDLDRQYAALVERTSRFGFTPANRALLEVLHKQFQEAAERNPTQYRRAQAEIIRLHRMVWQSGSFQKLAETVAARLR